MLHTLPKLQFNFLDLEPYIDTKTMELHYSKHHQTYVDKLNEALSNNKDLQENSPEELLTNLSKLPENIKTAVKNFGGGHFNHSFFWEILTLATNSKMGEKLTSKIVDDFGSVEEFKNKVIASGLGLFGSGWVWVAVNEQNKLEIINTLNQDNPITARPVAPILTLDVWEHAYYLKYQNRRKDYLEAIWNVLHWQKIESLYQSANS